MSAPSFPDFFRAATGNPAPFDYQRRLAEGAEPDGACNSRLIGVPTGCGKTAAVVLAWLWNRVLHPDAAHRATWPRRLVYCLPMRTLVEQTRDEVKKWLGDRCWEGGKADHTKKVGLHILMGGEEKANEWDTHPEADAILIGTQDMLLSRALNRGYGMSRYRWPMHFGLLNNDCLWVMDETQLMGVGVETSAQLDGFRHLPKLVTPTNCRTWWMSATLDDHQLVTVDHPKPPGGWPTTRLEGADLEPGSEAHKRRHATKILRPASVRLGGEEKPDAYPKRLASFIREKHQPETLTLVVLNRVARARAVYQQLLQQFRKEGLAEDRLALIHSRFRPGDRKRHETVLFAGNGDRIVIATQAIEAGVDVSARVLITELTPWPSLVQRFGRCNRRGEWNDTGGAEIFWIDLQPKDDKDDLVLPYTFPELKEAGRLLRADLPDASPHALAEVSYKVPPVVRSVVRRKDLLDLFDTTPDLLGHDLDIGRYVRDGDDTDVQVFWRNVPTDPAVPEPDEPDETRPELCRVSLADMRRFLKKKPRAFVWDALDEKWTKAGETPRPGQTYLIAHDAGGYDDRFGWTGDPVPKDGKLTLLTPPPDDASKKESYGGNAGTFLRDWYPLDKHTRDVMENVEALIRHLPLTDVESAALRDAARWHDVGKAHAGFQQMLQSAVREGQDKPCPDPASLWAKSAGHRPVGVKGRKGFRHELASALAWLQRGAPAGPVGGSRDLTAFLIAAHHGKVRLSIRSLPEESPVDPLPGKPDRLHARGVWDQEWLPGETSPAVQLEGLTLEPLKLDLGYMRMGDDEGEHGRGPSWLARMVALRDSPEFGPFRLAYLETLLRAADGLASAGMFIA